MPRLGIALCVLALTAGCVTVRPIGRIEAGMLPILEPDEAILVVHVHAEIPIAKLRISGHTALADLPKGEHFQLIVVNTGDHRWSSVAFDSGDHEVSFKPGREELWRFRAEPGRINYPGELTIGGSIQGKAVRLAPIGHRNRSALALHRLRERHPELLERYPPLYTGHRSDDYLDYYRNAFLTPATVAGADP